MAVNNLCMYALACSSVNADIYLGLRLSKPRRLSNYPATFNVDSAVKFQNWKKERGTFTCNLPDSASARERVQQSLIFMLDVTYKPVHQERQRFFA